MKLRWKLALVAVLIALAAAGMRLAVSFWEARPPSPEERVAEALALLADDPVAWRVETQFAVRAAAVAVDEARIETAPSCYVMGMQHQREADAWAAETMFKRAILLDPQWSWPYAALGSLIGRDTPERLDEAEQTLRKAIALDSDWARPHNSLAVVLRLRGRLDEAEKEAVRAIELAPEDIASQNNYANLLAYLGRTTEAEEHYRTALNLDPNHPRPYYNLACLYAQEGQEDDAMEMLTEAVHRSEALRREAMSDADLQELHDRSDFQELVYGPPAYVPAPPEGPGPETQPSETAQTPGAPPAPASNTAPGDATQTPAAPEGEK
jgi:Flp pilus assembly protein TadD